MASALVALATTTLASSSATVSFSSISGAYRDLRLVVTGVTTSGGGFEMGVRLNGDTSSNYARVYMLGNGSSTASGSDVLNYIDPGSIQVTQTQLVIDFMDYSATDKQKTYLIRRDDISSYTVALAGRWASTSAVTSMDVLLTGGASYAAGSTFSLYGVTA